MYCLNSSIIWIITFQTEQTRVIESKSLGASEFSYDYNSTNPFSINYIDPRRMFLEPDDASLRYKDSSFISHKAFISFFERNRPLPFKMTSIWHNRIYPIR